MTEGGPSSGGHSTEAKWWDGQPMNLAAAAADALPWLEILLRHQHVVNMPPADYINLVDCRAALAQFVHQTGDAHE